MASRSKSNKPRSNLFLSIAGALLGVQSSKRHAQDFASQSPLPYIIGGIVGVVLFVLLLWLLVSLVLG